MNVFLLLIDRLINYSLSLPHLVKLLLRPSSSQSPVGLGDAKETSFCNVTEEISISDPRKGLCYLLSLVFIGGRLYFIVS